MAISQRTFREKDGIPIMNRKTQVNKTNEKRSGMLSPLFIFAILLIPRLVAAKYSIIGDCDEGKNPMSRRS